MCVDDIRDDVVIHRGVLAQDRVDGDLALGRRDVGELRRSRIADAIADRPYAWDVGPHALIDGDPEPIGRQARLLDAREVRDPAGAEEDLIALERFLLSLDIGGDRDARTVPAHLGHLRVRTYLHAAGLEGAHEGPHHIGVGVRDGLREHLEHGHVGADLGEECPELEADRAAADHYEALRRLREREGAHVIEGLRIGQPLDRRHPDLRARSDDHGLRVDGLRADAHLRW